MSELKFQNGNVVRVKSNNVPMTVEGEFEKQVSCVWFEKRPDGSWGELQRKDFHQDDLVLVED